MVLSAFYVASIAIGLVAVTSVVLTAVHYPWHSDTVSDATRSEHEKDYYECAYAAAPTGSAAPPDDEYVRMARAHAAKAGIPQTIGSLLDRFGLRNARALECGAGSGLLQDLVRNYVAIDISSAARRFFHRPFVAASGTALPFRDDAFDVVWSVWVLEHVRNPERALAEIRRVVRHGGYVLLRPAWNCDAWAADGYEVRPYSDFGPAGKLVKASIPIRTSRWYALLHSRQVRLLRTLATAVRGLCGKPSRLRFTRLSPNYGEYWVTDSDAVVSLDFFELFLWFTSRGDTCPGVPSRNALVFGGPGRRPEFLVVRVNKAE
jgi:SAM-dependent methyltransferase